MTASPALAAQKLKPGVSIMQVDAETARRWLGQNVNNRRLRPAVVTGYARDMKAGRWAFTGEPIQFSASGKLENGQHRLHAIIEADVSIPMVVVRNLPAEAQKFMDAGSKRSASDALQISGRGGEAKSVAAIARGMLLWANGVRPTQAEVIAEAESAYDLYAQAAIVGNTVRRELRGGVALYGVAYMTLAAIDENDARWFFDHLATGVDLQSRDPILVLRRRIIAGIEGGRLESAMETNLALIFKAWNAWRAHKPVTLLRYSRTESFPEPK